MRYRSITVTELAKELRCSVEDVLELCHKIGIAAGDRMVEPQADRVRRHHAERALDREGVHRPPRRGELRAARSSSVVFSLDESGANGTACVTVDEPRRLDCVSVGKQHALEKRGLSDEPAWQAVCAVALAAAATVEVDTHHGERRLRVSLPSAGGHCVVILTRHRRTGALAVVTAFHDCRPTGFCRQEFLAEASVLGEFVAPSARLAALQ